MSILVFDRSNLENIYSHYIGYSDYIKTNYEPEKRENMLPPLLKENCFHFDRDEMDSTLMELFSIIRQGMEKASSRLFRVYLDGNLSAEADDWIRYSDPQPEETFSKWLARTTGNRNFGIIVNNVEKWSNALAHVAANFAAPIREQLGKNLTDVDVSLFIGNYGFTPFGVHLDDPYSSVVHLHLGPGPKVMYLWDDETFRQAEGLRNRFDVEKLAGHAEIYTIKEGDAFVLPPSYWHIGQSSEFSVGLAIAITCETPDTLAAKSLNAALSRLESNAELEQYFSSEDANVTSIKSWYNASHQIYSYKLESNRGLQSSYTPPSHINSHQHLEKQRVILDDTFPPLVSKIDGKHFVFSRGNQYEISTNRVFEHLSEIITKGPVETQSVTESLGKKDLPIARECTALFYWLIETGSLCVLNDNNQIASTPRLDNLPALKGAVSSVLNHSGASFFDLAPLMDSLLRDDIINLLNDILEKREITSSYELLSEDHIYLHRQPNFHLLMRFIGRNSQDTLYANEFDIFVINPTTEDITLPLYECHQSNTLECPEKLSRLDDIILKPGKSYRFEAYKYIIDFSCEAKDNSFVLIAHSDLKGWLTWVYDRNSLEPIESICTSLQASRIQLYVRLLGSMNATQSLPVLEKIALSDYASFVRWEAIESISQIDPQRCFAVLKKLAEYDPDPMLRQAAENSLQLSNVSHN